MTARICQTCKHYEPSSTWRRGWCRNPRLYSPQQSHPVNQDSLDCSRGLGHSWEPAEGLEDRAPLQGRHPLWLFGPRPEFAPAGAGMMASSGTDFGGGATGGGEGSAVGGPPRSDRGGPPPGQERTVSYQPEDRYWTDYLRIALPVVGLLLLIGVFWYWAAALIGNGDDDEPPPTSQAAAVIDEFNASPTAPPQSPTPIPPTPSTGVTQPTPTATTPPPTPQPTTAPAAQPTATRSPNDMPVYPVNARVVTTEAVNLRQEASTDSPAVELLPVGTQLEITGAFVDSGNPAEFDWWPVRNPANDNEGFVREDFLQAAGQ